MADLTLICLEPQRRLIRDVDDPRDGWIPVLNAGDYYSVRLANLDIADNGEWTPIDRSADTITFSFQVADGSATSALAAVTSWTQVLDDDYSATVPVLEGTLNMATTAISDAISAAVATGVTYINLIAAVRKTPAGGNPLTIASQTVRVNIPQAPSTFSGTAAGVYDSGTQAVSIGADSVTVTFSTAKAATWAFDSLALQWANGSNVENILLGPVIAKSTTGFTVLLSGSPSGSGLSLLWRALN